MQSTTSRIGRGDARLYADPGGAIWCYQSSHAQRKGVNLLGQGEAAFDSSFFRELIESDDRVCLLADQHHADLLGWLLNKLPHRRVWLGRPCFDNDVGASVLSMFPELSPFDLPTSVGGWRPATHADAVTYRLRALLAECEKPADKSKEFASLSSFHITKELRNVLKEHPAWPAVAFPSGGCLLDAAKVLLEILDPRWHIEPEFPDRSNALYRYFGVHDRQGLSTARQFIADVNFADTAEDYRASCLFHAFLDGESTSVSRDAEAQLRFWPQMWAKSRQSQATTLALAARKYLDFVSSVWLDRLTPQRVYLARGVKPGVLVPEREYSPTLFVAPHFFPTQDVVLQWRHSTAIYNV